MCSSVCALLYGIRKDRHKKRHWVHPVGSRRLLNGQLYKLYEDLTHCGQVTQICVFNTVKLGTSASSP